MHCLHRTHSFKVYGRSTYADQTCKQCLLASKGPSTRFFTQASLELGSSGSSRASSAKSRLRELPSTSDALSPIRDTPSHFPSAGNDAAKEVYTPHKPLLNAMPDIRPSEVPEFIEVVANPSSEIVEACKPPWEEKQDDELMKREEAEEASETTDRAKQNENNPKTNELQADEAYTQSLLTDKEKLNRLATREFYKTSTQRQYEDVEWKKMIRKAEYPVAELPLHHDTNDLNQQINRYKGNKQLSQEISFAAWDGAQSRNGFFVKRPVAYKSISKSVDHIPNYKGSIGGFGERDVEKVKFTPLTLMRTEQPKYQESSRKPYIPGYGGCTLWSKSSEVLSREKMPRVETTARVHSRFMTYPQNDSLFAQKGMVSSSVTLVNPFNPYNKIDFSLNRTASGSRIY